MNHWVKFQGDGEIGNHKKCAEVEYNFLWVITCYTRGEGSTTYTFYQLLYILI